MANDCDCGISDWRVMLKNAFVFIIAFFGLIYFVCFQRLCGDQRVGLSDCRYVYFGGDMEGSIGVAAVWYTCFYAILMVFSILGLFNVCCSKLGCNKLYAIGMVGTFFCITLCDWMTMGAVASTHEGSQNLREFYTFQVLLFWILQLGVICSAAYDAYYQGCGKRIMIHNKAGSVVMISKGEAE